MRKLTRRAFIGNVAKGAFGLGFGSVISTRILAQAAGSNGDIRAAIVGLHSKGKSHIEDFMAHKGARIVALCDVDKNLLDAVFRGQLPK